MNGIDKKLIIKSKGSLIWFLYFCDGKPYKINVVKKQALKTTQGNIYLSKVSSLEKNSRQAFVEFQKNRTGYLKLDKKAPVPKVGDKLIVQAKAVVEENKKVPFTENVKLKGLYVIVEPFTKGVYYSKKLSETKKNKLKLLFEAEKTLKFGVIIRSAAEDIAEEKIIEDIHLLEEKWDNIQTKSQSQKCPSLLNEETIFENIIFDYPKVEGILCDSSYTLNSINDVFSHYDEHLNVSLDPTAISDEVFDDLISSYLSPNISLDTGENILFHEHSTATLIDVNSGSNHGDFNDINERAANEIAHQLCVRNISGLILIDFITITIKEKREKLYKRLQHIFKKYFNQIYISPMSRHGIVEITIPKTFPSLQKNLTSVCPTCNGSIHIMALHYMVDQLVRDCQKHFKHNKTPQVTIVAHPQTIHGFKVYCQSLSTHEIKETFGIMPNLQEDVHCHYNDYDII